MQIVSLEEAKTHFFKLVKTVIDGNEIIITKSGKPVAKLCPIIKSKKRTFGILRGKIRLTKDFNAPLSNTFLNDFEA